MIRAFGFQPTSLSSPPPPLSDGLEQPSLTSSAGAVRGGVGAGGSVGAADGVGRSVAVGGVVMGTEDGAGVAAAAARVAVASLLAADVAPGAPVRTTATEEAVKRTQTPSRSDRI